MSSPVRAWRQRFEIGNAITSRDFATLPGVRRYVGRCSATSCREIACAVALQVRRLVNAARTRAE
jgi:hypothetical protein